MALTRRQAIVATLQDGEVTFEDLRRLHGVPVAVLAEDLRHVARSYRRGAQQLHVEPASCIACGFVFRDRRRFTDPGRCPRCRSEQVAPARYHIG